jgi:fumarylacetoacetase
MTMLDDTHRPDLVSWVESAQAPSSDFPIQSLPFGVFRRGGEGAASVGVAIGDQIVDITSCARDGLFTGGAARAAACCDRPFLNALMELGRGPARELRRRLSEILRADVPAGDRSRAVADRILVPMDEAELVLPARIGDYTDFYASISHATNVGGMFRPDNPLLPNYKWVPVGYHGRASSIVVSGTDVRRPVGQSRDGAEGPPSFAPTRRLDYELEIGAYVAGENALGTPIPLADAEEHLFGLSLLNDWSARDVQAWEYQPLGPFLAKNFATTVSPWVVTLDALEPYRARAFPRPVGDPPPLAYLFSENDLNRGGFDIILEVWMTTAQMRASGRGPFLVSVGAFTDMYWTMAQLLTHHTSNGCNLRPGDLLGSGTVSGATPESRGCLLERSWRGTEPLRLPGGEIRAFLHDGDDVVFRGYCERSGHPRIGFGECRGRVLPAAST